MEMVERHGNENEAWSAFTDASQDSKADALLDLYVSLDSAGSDDSIGAGFAAFESLLKEKRFEQAAFVARSLASELGDLERFGEAREILEAALKSSLWISDFEVGMLYYANGRNYVGEASFAEAEFLFEQAVALLETENERLAGFAYKELAEVRIELNNCDNAIKAYSASISLLERCAETAPVGHAKRRLGEALFSQGHLTMAEKYLRDAIAILSFGECLDERWGAELALGRLLIELKSFDEATEVLNRLTANKSESRLMAISAEAFFYLHKLRVATGMGPISKSEQDSLIAVLSASGLYDLADSVKELSESF